MRSRLASCVVGGIVLAFAQTAVQAKDFNKLLDGEYMVTGFASCINSFNGFNANLQANPPAPGQPGPFFQSFDIQGARTFNGDGTGSASGRNISVFPPNQFAGASASESEFSGNFTYEVHPDLTITIVQGPLSGSNTAGGAAGQTFTVTGIPNFSGRISEDLQTIIITHAAPGIETLTPSAGLARQRICARSRTLTRVKRGG
jgi:hypothetical protein